MIDNERAALLSAQEHGPGLEMLRRPLDPKNKPKPDATQVARRAALRSAVRRIRRRYGAGAIRWASASEAAP